MQKILLMNALFKPNIGGIENSLVEIANVLYNAGYQVDIFCSDRNNENNESLEMFESHEEYNIYRYKYNFGRISTLKNSLSSLKALKRVKKDNKYSYIVSRNYFLVIVGRLTGLKGIKYIAPQVNYHSYKGSKDKVLTVSTVSKIAKSTLQWLSFLLAKEVFVFSESMVKQVTQASLGIITPKLVEPGVNFQRFSIATSIEKINLRSKYGIPENSKVILALGRFSDIKQFDLAILAMNQLQDSLLILVGSGPELKTYQDLIISHGLKDKVKVFEATNNPEEFYKISDTFLMTSRYESFGQTILEAAISGLQIVAFNQASGVNTNVENMLLGCDGVYLVDDQSPKSLATAIFSSFKDKEIERPDYIKNQNLITERYSWNKFISGLCIVI